MRVAQEEVASGVTGNRDTTPGDRCSS